MLPCVHDFQKLVFRHGHGFLDMFISFHSLFNSVFFRFGLAGVDEGFALRSEDFFVEYACCSRVPGRSGSVQTVPGKNPLPNGSMYIQFPFGSILLSLIFHSFLRIETCEMESRVSDRNNSR